MWFFSRLLAGPPRGETIPMEPVRRKELFFSYSQDWIVTLLLFLIFALIDRVPGFQREFDINDTSISHTFAVKERVPFYAAVLLAGLFPFFSILGYSLIWVRSPFDAHQGALGFVLSLAITTTLTDIVKITVGRPRPDLLARCMLPPGTVNAIPGLVTSALCTQPNKAILADGFKSFFSGHASFSFAGLSYLSFYLAGKLHLFDQAGYVLKAWVVLFPFLIAAGIAISRTMDYRHHATDVLIGGIVGTVISYITYRLYYPSLAHPMSHKPFSPRATAFTALNTNSPSKQVPGILTNGAGGQARSSPTPVGEDPFNARNRAGVLEDRSSSGHSHSQSQGQGQNGWTAVRSSEDRRESVDTKRDPVQQV